MNRLLLLPFHAGPGPLQMGIDAACGERVSREPTLAILRFYRFSPACVSLGRFQKLDTVNLAAIRAAGVDLVRRDTGGRAVLHDHELTYMVAAGCESPLYPGGIRGSMARVTKAFQQAFALFQLNTEAEGSRKPVASTRGACFDAPSLLELKSSGLKLVGSAQRRLRDGFVQHGSIPLDYDEERNRAWLGAPDHPHAATAPFLRDPELAERFMQAVAEYLAGENGLMVESEPMDSYRTRSQQIANPYLI